MKLGRLLRTLISALLIGILVYVAVHQNIWATLKTADPRAVLLACAFLAVGWLFNSLRWWLLLRVVGVAESPPRLGMLYFAGMFFSQLLPTGAGGDAVRMLELYRRGHKPAPVIVATLQERLMGMGVSMLLGLAMLPLFWSQLPAAWRPVLVLVPAAAVIGVAIFLYPRVPMRWAAALGLQRLNKYRFVHRVSAAIAPAADFPALTPVRLVPIGLVTLAGVLLTMSSWFILAQTVGLAVPFTGICLVIPMVWVISMAPSLGGAGVREMGFVGLMKLFDAPPSQSLACAALYLLVQTVLALVGGVLFLGSLWMRRGKMDSGQLNSF